MADFFWYDVMTAKTAEAETFYCKVMEWSAAPAGSGDVAYTVFSASEIGVAGLMAPPYQMPSGFSAVWRGYIHVTDIDEYAMRITSAGGRICREPWDAPGVGRFLVAADPEGAVFVLMHPHSSEQRPTVTAGTPGHVGWHELISTNWENAFTFYSTLFGWKKTTAMDMGPMGTYQMFATDQVDVGGMMSTQGLECKDIGSYWFYYFNVARLDEAVARVQEQGGKITREPHEVPGGSWIAHAVDPHGAHFGLVASTR